LVNVFGREGCPPPPPSPGSIYVNRSAEGSLCPCISFCFFDALENPTKIRRATKHIAKRREYSTTSVDGLLMV